MTKTFTLSRTKLNLLAVLAVIGLAISIVQTMHFAEVRLGKASFDSFCTIGKTFDCNAIDASPYSELFAGIPLSAAAAGWWLAILVFSLAARSAEFAAMLAPVLLAMTLVGAVFSLLYLWIMVAALKVGCLLCLAIDAINFTAFGALLHSWIKRDRSAKVVIDFKMPAMVTGASLLVVILFARGMQQGVPDNSAINLRVDSILASQTLDVPVPPEAPIIGNPMARVTIVKFSDFQCPSCRMGAQALHPVLKRYGDRVRFMYRNFPLDMSCNRAVQNRMHSFACELARGTICAQAQGKFEPYYEQVFENQASLKSGSALEFARKLGMDAAKFEACLSEQSTIDRVSRDIEDGITLNVQSTPTFFLNGKRVEGALPPQAWNRLIEAALK
jgi:protein-disulfide isomerase